MTNLILREKLECGESHVRFAEWKVASVKSGRGARLGKHLTVFSVGVLCAASVAADTFYGKASTADGEFPNGACVWYTDEACTTKTALQGLSAGQVNPTANDGHTYVILSSKGIKASYVAPEGTQFAFRTGTGSIRYAKSGTNDWKTVSVRTAQVCATSDAFVLWKGMYTLEDNASLTFTTDSGGYYGLQGHELAGTYVAPESAKMTLSSGWRSDSSDTDKVRLTESLTGDFTAFRGKLLTAKPGGAYRWNTVSLESASAFGAADVECDDYLTLAHRNVLRLAPTVTQYATKGIKLSLSSSETAAIEVNAGDAVTLTAPLAGAAGTLEKRGAGSLTLAGAVAATNIFVARGTLVLAPAASFASGAKVTVGAGACVSYAAAPDGVTIELQAGASRVQPTVSVPFDGTTATPVALSDGYSAAAGVTPIALSQAIPIPLVASNRWAVATVPHGRLTAADFRDDSPKTYRLPKTWVEIETDASTGLQTVYLAARPALDYLNETTDITNESNYRDGKSPSFGNDYYYTVARGQNRQRIGGGVTKADVTYPGETMSVIDSQINNYCHPTTISNVTLFALGSILHYIQNTVDQTRYPCQTLRGHVTVDESSTDEQPASIDTSSTAGLQLDMSISGSGFLAINQCTGKHEEYGNADLRQTVFMYGDNSAFVGRLKFVGKNKTSDYNVVITNANALGGPLPTLDKYGVEFAPHTTPHVFRVRADESVTVDAANRGWTGTYLTLGAAEGKSLVFAPPYLRAANSLSANGPGVVALGVSPLIEGSSAKTFRIDAGYVKCVDATSYLAVTNAFAAGAGIAIDEQSATDGAATYGIRPLAITRTDPAAKIPVRILPTSGSRLSAGAPLTWTICTVPESHADLTDVFEPEPLRGCTCVGVVKESLTGADAGNVRYRVTYARKGIVLIVR